MIKDKFSWVKIGKDLYQYRNFSGIVKKEIHKFNNKYCVNGYRFDRLTDAKKEALKGK